MKLFSRPFAALLIAVLCALLSGPAHAGGRPIFLTPDNWGGRDAHQTVSGVVGMGVQFQFRDAWTWPEKAALCLAPGAAKELLDYAGGSGVSRRDMLSNAAGCAMGFGLASGLLYLTRTRDGAAGLASTQLTWRVVLP